MWTKFWDMNSGGGRKEKWDKIYIEAPMNEAKIIFYNRFDHSPDRVTCTCCGEDYSISSGESLADLTGYHRNCKYDDKKKGYVEEPDNRYGRQRLVSLEEYINQPNVLVIYEKDIKPEERVGEVPQQGYVWM